MKINRKVVTRSKSIIFSPLTVSTQDNSDKGGKVYKNLCPSFQYIFKKQEKYIRFYLCVNNYYLCFLLKLSELNYFQIQRLCNEVFSLLNIQRDVCVRKISCLSGLSGKLCDIRPVILIAIFFPAPPTHKRFSAKRRNEDSQKEWTEGICL